ncbi:hypothetical protein SAMN04489729_0827 [Amycolatopsis lurida]|uniref:Uncharacterized protein n=1 Tax=Amycolatopsis lurida NRRL 2430 TaxID=1460371 RepID=A0A2P2FM36_AMYLU|nr:hypothetical protein [Amycolatopsis lurida]KFU77780.1 hypothetical protein BB31_29380 [Amycolatopsis lurida NRRL 2430]SEB39012.1 hypothetical protein SAMN04489729_0827 [Amycolatopsis lurida]
MSSDEHDFSAFIPGLSPIDAHEVYLLARGVFVSSLRSAVLDCAETRERYYAAVSGRSLVLRVLHLISTGYGGTPKFNAPELAPPLWQAVLSDFVHYDEDEKVHVITEKGRGVITRWYELVQPIKDHPRFAPLWAEVTD